MKNYNFKEIETKWQKKWYDNNVYKAIDFHPTKPKYYVLWEFPNISGNAHLGHLKATIPADALARYKRFNGYNVLYPFGGDSFGLPAENAAIKKGIDPHIFVKNGMNVMMDFVKRTGLSMDLQRCFCTSDEDYYKWTQWIFLQLYNNGKAYKQKDTVNFCPKCKTTLSNEDSQGGKCDRCGTEVIQKERDVWFLKMEEYAKKLLNNVDKIEMSEHLKTAQRNWIGESEGVNIKFKIYNSDDENVGETEIFTTCAETIYGVTFIVFAPENKLIDKFKNNINNFEKVIEYRKETSFKTDFDRKFNQKNKSGCVLEGLYAVNPINNKKVPIYISDFVISNYGTGAVMAVPTHDQRDYEFAKTFNIEMIQVIDGDCSKSAVEKKEYMSKNSKMINSDEFSGMFVKEAKEKIIEKIVKNNWGHIQTYYNMKDWSFNRQRYWGEPIPIVFCEKCGTVPLSEKDLPLILPKTTDYLPNKNGDSPLSKIDSFVNCKCPKCGGLAKRETDTMPNWAGSSWYWLRFTDPFNKEKLADYDKLKYWGSVDCYTGGVEHITRHVLYSFFWQNFLYEIGAVPTRDPFIRKMGSGLILDDEGKKMSKSSKNGVSPIEVFDKYGADVTRLHIQFLSAYEDNVIWTFKGIEGIVSFVNKVWNLQDMIIGEEISKNHEVEINKLIKKVGYDIENFKLNTAIASFMAFVNKIKEDKYITKEELKIFLILLNPIAPYVTSEIFENIFNKDINNEVWPKFDECKIESDSIKLPIQINGKVKNFVNIQKQQTKEEVIDLILNNKLINIDKSDIKNIVFVPNKIINFITK